MAKVKDTKVYSINDFISWSNRGELEISPKYQRNPVWNIKAKSYLIDTIIRGLPVPQIFMRQIIDVKTKTTRREIIDGQQRLRTILEFVDDQFRILKSHNSEFGDKTFSELPEDIQEDILSYDLPVEIVTINEDSIVYDMFARVNTNSMTLNSQELRNAKYWGEFKVFIYTMAAKFRDFFINIGMFNDKQLSRMYDTEYISSLVIALIDGIITETSKKIDSYYEKYDEVFDEIEDIEYKLERIISVSEKILCESNFTSNFFHRKVYFYTLFMTLNNMMFNTNDINSKYSDKNIEKNISNLIINLSEFESKYDRYLNSSLYDKSELDKFIKFDKNHRSRTTSQVERKERVDILTGELNI